MDDYEFSLNNLAKQVLSNAENKGWYEDGAGTNMGERIALIHSEASEMLEADRNDFYFNNRFPDDLGKQLLHRINSGSTEREEAENLYIDHVKGTFEEELADVIIRCLDMAAFKGIDIESHVLAKMRYNETRPFKHGGKAY